MNLNVLSSFKVYNEVVILLHLGLTVLSWLHSLSAVTQYDYIPTNFDDYDRHCSMIFHRHVKANILPQTMQLIIPQNVD